MEAQSQHNDYFSYHILPGCVAKTNRLLLYSVKLHTSPLIYRAHKEQQFKTNVKVDFDPYICMWIMRGRDILYLFSVSIIMVNRHIINALQMAHLKK